MTDPPAAGPGPAVVTVGNFDGVHRGHQFMLGQVVDRARALALPSLAVTFDPDPHVVLQPDRPFTALISLDEKVRLMHDLGIDQVWVCPFTLELSRLSAREFIDLVAERTPIGELWVGFDFALGRDRSGTFGVLARLAATDGFALHLVPPHRVDGLVVSSTEIRRLLATGGLEEASRLLGRSVPGTRRAAFTASET